MTMHIIIPTIQPATIPPTPEEEFSPLVCLPLETLAVGGMDGVVVGLLVGITLEDVMPVCVTVVDVLAVAKLVDIISVDVVLVNVILVDVISVDATMVEVMSKDFALTGITLVEITGTVEQYN